jgi:hypothetical protein
MNRGNLRAAAPTLLALVCLYSFTPRAHAQHEGGHWVEASDPVAKELTDKERRWAELPCHPGDVIEEILADDFAGVSPEGEIYSKKDALAEHHPPVNQVHDCKLLNARVRAFAPGLAVVYGRETAIFKGPNGKDIERMLIWSDTWLKRDGKWQIISAQDMPAPHH